MEWLRLTWENNVSEAVEKPISMLSPSTLITLEGIICKMSKKGGQFHYDRPTLNVTAIYLLQKHLQLRKITATLKKSVVDSLSQVRELHKEKSVRPNPGIQLVKSIIPERRGIGLVLKRKRRWILDQRTIPPTTWTGDPTMQTTQEIFHEQSIH